MKNTSIFRMQVHPLKQAGIAVSIELVILLLVKLMMRTGTISDNPTFCWEVVFTLMLAYMLFNAMLSFPYKNRNQYFVYSLIGYVIVALLGGIMAHLFSGVSMDEAGSFRWLYMLLTFCYLVFLTIANAIWKIIEMAKKQDSRMRGGN